MGDKDSQWVEDEDMYVPTPLHAAVENQDHAEVARLLRLSNETVNLRDDDYTTLHIAINNNDITSVQVLLQYGADPELLFPWEEGICSKMSSVSQAADLGFLEILRVLIDNDASMPSVALYRATRSGQIECVKEIYAWLVNNHRMEFDDRVTKSAAVSEALRIAAGGWRVDIVGFILASGEADVNAVDCAFREVMVTADYHDDFMVQNCVRQGPEDEARRKRVEVMKLLLDAGADIEAAVRLSSVGAFTMKSLHEIARQGSEAREIFDILLDRNVDLESLNNEGTKWETGKTPLFQAVLANDVYFVERLVEKGARVTQVDKSGNTLLHASVFNEWPACSAIMTRLLSYGLDDSIANAGGRTALHEASSKGNVAAVKLLLSHNSDLIKFITSEGWTALHFAADPYSEQGKIDVCEVLLAYGADINAVTVKGWTILHQAIMNNRCDDTSLISLLLYNGADVTANDKAGDSPLHLSLDQYHFGSRTTNMLKLLLDSGADIEYRDSQGRTPLLRAVGKWSSTTPVDTRFQSENMMELLDRGADMDVKDNVGLGFEDRVINKGYKIMMDNGKVVGFERVPVQESDVRQAGQQYGLGRGWGRGRGRKMERTIGDLGGAYVRVNCLDRAMGHGQHIEIP